MLDRGNGIVLKAMQEPPRGTREIELYQVVFSPVCTDKDLLELRNFIPWFYGTEERDEGEDALCTIALFKSIHIIKLLQISLYAGLSKKLPDGF